MAIRELGRDKTNQFSSFGFGNFLGSNGSVVPIFQQQIEASGPVTVTHPDAERYFMTAREAAGLILLAATIGNNQEIYLLDMGDPVNINSLAHTMIELSGMIPDQDIKIIYTGLKKYNMSNNALSPIIERYGSVSAPTSNQTIETIDMVPTNPK